MSRSDRYVAARAALAGEISDPGATGRAIRDFIVHKTTGGTIDWMQNEDLYEVMMFLGALREAVDPEGKAHHRLVIKRVRAGNLVKKSGARSIGTKLMAARKVDRLIAGGMERKRAMGQVADETGVSQAEIYKARKHPFYAGVEKISRP